MTWTWPSGSASFRMVLSGRLRVFQGGSFSVAKTPTPQILRIHNYRSHLVNLPTANPARNTQAPQILRIQNHRSLCHRANLPTANPARNSMARNTQAPQILRIQIRLEVISGFRIFSMAAWNRRSDRNPLQIGLKQKEGSHSRYLAIFDCDPVRNPRIGTWGSASCKARFSMAACTVK